MIMHIARLTLLPLLLVACVDGGAPLYELSGATMGTRYTVKIGAAHAEHAGAALQAAIDERLESINAGMSTYLPDSELSRFNAMRSTAPFEVSAELCALVEQALAFSERTGGAFDVTVGPLVNLWGFGPDASTAAPPSPAAIGEVAAAVGYRHLSTDCSVPALRKRIDTLYVDLSALAKGYAVDEIAALLDAKQIGDYMVEIGGELRVRGRNAKNRPWAIGIEAPNYADRSVRTVVGVSDTAVATSGDYRNYFEFEGRHYSHMIDPRTGRPAEHDGASVTVVAESAAFADAMATALLVLGPEAGLDYAEREGIAAFFLLRSGGGLEERATKPFTTLVARQ